MAQQLICSACGHIGNTKRSVKGSLGVEILLWLCFLIPGIIYSLWRQSTYHKACSVCGGTNLIPVNSPVGQRLLKNQGIELETPEINNTKDILINKFSTKQKILTFWILVAVVSLYIFIVY